MLRNGGCIMFEFDQFIWTFVFHIINAVILFFILRRLLFKPVKKFLDQRENKFRQQVQEIDERQSEIEKLQIEYTKRLEQAKSEAASIIEQANELANEHLRDAKQKAQEQSKAMLERVRKQLESERDQVMDELKADTAKMAIEIASKILQRNINAEDNQKIIEEFLERVR